MCVLSKFNAYSSIVLNVFVCIVDLYKDGAKSIKKEREKEKKVSLGNITRLRSCLPRYELQPSLKVVENPRYLGKPCNQLLMSV